MLAEQLLQNAVLGPQEFDGLLLFTMDRGRQNRQQELPRVHKEVNRITFSF